MTDVTNVNSANVWVRIDDDADHQETFEAIEGAVRAVPDVDSEVVTYTEKRIQDVGALTTGDNPVRGDGLDVLTGADQPLDCSRVRRRTSRCCARRRSGSGP